MDPLSTTLTFATLVQLLQIFLSERQTQSNPSLSLQDFQSWLETEDARHQLLINEIKSNQTLARGIQSILSQNHMQIMASFNLINESVSKIASKLAGFNQVVSAMSPDLILSDQALSILKQLEMSGGSRFIEIVTLDGTSYEVLDVNYASIEVPEWRFVDDDLNTLVSLGLLKQDQNYSDDRLWIITRQGAKVASASHT